MAYENVDEFGGSIGVEGQVYPFIPNQIETAIIQDEIDEVGGFFLLAVKGIPGKVWATQTKLVEDNPGLRAENIVVMGWAQFTSLKEGYEKGDLINVMRKGRMYIKAHSTVRSGKYVNFDDDYWTEGDNDDGLGKFVTNGNAGDLVEIELG